MTPVSVLFFHSCPGFDSMRFIHNASHQVLVVLVVRLSTILLFNRFFVHHSLLIWLIHIQSQICHFEYPFELFYQIDWCIFNVKFSILNSRFNFSTRFHAYICIKVTSKIWFWIMPVIIENSCHNYDVLGLWVEKFHNDIGQYPDLSSDQWLKISLIQSKSVLRSG